MVSYFKTTVQYTNQDADTNTTLWSDELRFLRFLKIIMCVCVCVCLVPCSFIIFRLMHQPPQSGHWGFPPPWSPLGCAFTSMPKPRQLLICPPFLRLCHFKNIMNGIIQYVTLPDWTFFTQRNFLEMHPSHSLHVQQCAEPLTSQHTSLPTHDLSVKKLPSTFASVFGTAAWWCWTFPRASFLTVYPLW